MKIKWNKSCLFFHPKYVFLQNLYSIVFKLVHKLGFLLPPKMLFKAGILLICSINKVLKGQLQLYLLLELNTFFIFACMINFANLDNGYCLSLKPLLRYRVLKRVWPKLQWNPLMNVITMSWIFHLISLSNRLILLDVS